MKTAAILPMLCNRDVMHGKSIAGHVLLSLGLSFPRVVHMGIGCTLERECLVVLRDCSRQKWSVSKGCL